MRTIFWPRRGVVLRRFSLLLTIVVIGLAQLGAAFASIDAKPPPPRDVDELLVSYGLSAYFAFERYSVEFPGRETLLESAWTNLSRRAGVPASARPEPAATSEEEVSNDLAYAILHSRTQATQEQLLDAYIYGMVAVADDSHTSYGRISNPAPTSGAGTPSYGFQIMYDRGWAVVFFVRDGSPAEYGGLQVGDVVMSINGARPGYAQPPGLNKSMTVKILRGDRHVSMTFEPTFSEAPAIESRPIADGLGYIRVNSFNKPPRSFVDDLSLAALHLSDAMGVIVDLRQNAGGLLKNSAALAAALGYQGVVATFIDRDGQRETEDATAPAPTSRLAGLPIVVLVNENTYSAAEVAAYVLQESVDATVLGSPSAGAVRGGAIFALGTGRLSIGIAQILTGPALVDLEGVGVTPDEEVKQDFRRLRKGEDTVLLRAIEILEAPGSGRGR